MPDFLTKKERKPKGPHYLPTKSVAKQRELTALRCVEIAPRNLTILELEPNDCRYPYGEQVITFCGHPKESGSSYCFPHQRLTLGHSPLISEAERQRRRQTHANNMRNQALGAVA